MSSSRSTAISNPRSQSGNLRLFQLPHFPPYTIPTAAQIRHSQALIFLEWSTKRLHGTYLIRVHRHSYVNYRTGNIRTINFRLPFTMLASRPLFPAVLTQHSSSTDVRPSTTSIRRPCIEWRRYMPSDLIHSKMLSTTHRLGWKSPRISSGRTSG